MSDRPIIYTDEGLRSFDHLSAWKDYTVGIGRAMQALLGSIAGNNIPLAFGFAASAQTSPNMTINIAEGQVMSWSALDTTNFGVCAPDARMIIQSGYAAAQTLTFSTSGLSTNQSQCFLVQVAFESQDIIRTGDPTNGVLPYVNTANLTDPLQGPNGLGGTQPSERNGFANVTVLSGTIVTSPTTPTPPSPSSGAVGLWVVTLSNTTTSITSGLIAPYSGTAQLAGLLNQHHTGVAGQAPQIDLTAEVRNVLPLAHLPASNTVGILPTLRTGTTNPNGNLAGNVDDFYLQNGSVLWACTTTGSSTTAVWTVAGGGGNVIYQNTFPFTVQPGNNIYLCDTTSAAGTANLPLTNTMGGTTAGFVVIGGNALSLAPQAGEFIYPSAAGVSYLLNVKGQGIRLAPQSGVGWYSAP